MAPSLGSVDNRSRRRRSITVGSPTQADRVGRSTSRPAPGATTAPSSSASANGRLGQQKGASANAPSSQTAAEPGAENLSLQSGGLLTADRSLRGATRWPGSTESTDDLLEHHEDPRSASCYVFSSGCPPPQLCRRVWSDRRARPARHRIGLRRRGSGRRRDPASGGESISTRSKRSRSADMSAQRSTATTATSKRRPTFEALVGSSETPSERACTIASIQAG